MPGQSYSRNMVILFVFVSISLGIDERQLSDNGISAPNAVIFAGKDAIQKIVVEEDLTKSPEYEWIRSKPEISNLLTERDKVTYRQKVSTWGLCGIYCVLG